MEQCLNVSAVCKARQQKDLLSELTLLLQVACLIRVPSEVVKQRAQVSSSSSTLRILSHTLYHEVSSKQNLKEVASFFQLSAVQVRKHSYNFSPVLWSQHFPTYSSVVKSDWHVMSKETKPPRFPCVCTCMRTLNDSFVSSSFYMGYLQLKKQNKTQNKQKQKNAQKTQASKNHKNTQSTKKINTTKMRLSFPVSQILRVFIQTALVWNNRMSSLCTQSLLNDLQFWSRLGGTYSKGTRQRLCRSFGNECSSSIGNFWKIRAFVIFSVVILFNPVKLVHHCFYRVSQGVFCKFYSMRESGS